ncbi:hypothetical protein K9U39_07610 [Rhodoblastus acidophilus]|nr:hypothetical protein [Rhodoblastus acidophilus]
MTRFREFTGGLRRVCRMDMRRHPPPGRKLRSAADTVGAAPERGLQLRQPASAVRAERKPLEQVAAPLSTEV